MKNNHTVHIAKPLIYIQVDEALNGARTKSGNCGLVNTLQGSQKFEFF